MQDEEHIKNFKGKTNSTIFILFFFSFLVSGAGNGELEMDYGVTKVVAGVIRHTSEPCHSVAFIIHTRPTSNETKSEETRQNNVNNNK